MTALFLVEAADRLRGTGDGAGPSDGPGELPGRSFQRPLSLASRAIGAVTTRGDPRRRAMPQRVAGQLGRARYVTPAISWTIRGQRGRPPQSERGPSE
jgi:hypothetical protein